MTALPIPEIPHDRLDALPTDTSIHHALGESATMTVVFAANKSPQVVRRVEGLGDLLFREGYPNKVIEHVEGLGDLVVVPPTDFYRPEELTGAHDPQEIYVKPVSPHQSNHPRHLVAVRSLPPDDSLPTIRHLRAG